MSRFDISKGERFSLTKNEDLNNLTVVLGWKGDADLDVCAFLVGESGVIEDDANFVYFKSENRSEPFDRAKFGNKNAWRAQTLPMSADGSVLGSSDEREAEATSSDDGATEMMTVDLSKVDAKVAEIIFCASIYNDGISFSNVESPYISIVNDDNGEELCRYTLNEAFSGENALAAASLSVNEDGEWEFNAIGKAFMGGMGALIEVYAE